MNRYLICLGLIWHLAHGQVIFRRPIASAAGSITALSGTAVSCAGTAPSCAFSPGATGDLVLICYASSNVGEGYNTPTNSGGETVSSMAARVESGGSSAQCFSFVATSTSSHTIDGGMAFGDVTRMAVFGISGAKTTSYLDTTATASGTSTSLDSGTFTTTANCFIAGVMYGPGNSPTASGSWSNAVADISLAIVYQANKSAAAYNATATIGASSGWLAYGFGIKNGP